MDTLAVQLMVPTTKSIADFHRQVTAHVGRINKNPVRINFPDRASISDHQITLSIEEVGRSEKNGGKQY